MRRIIGWAIAIWVFAYLVMLVVIGAGKVWNQTKTTFSNPEFWVEKHIVLAVFGLLVALVEYFLQQNVANRERKDFEGWTVKVIRDVNPDDPEQNLQPEYTKDLWWQEVRSFSESYFERRKFIQSVASSEDYNIKSGEIDVEDQKNWVYRDGKRYVFDFRRAQNFEDNIEKREPKKSQNSSEQQAKPE